MNTNHKSICACSAKIGHYLLLTAASCLELPRSISATDLKLGHFPSPSSLTLATLPSISLIPSAPFTDFETRSFPNSLAAYPRDFAFCLADPISSIHKSVKTITISKVPLHRRNLMDTKLRRGFV